MSKKITTLVYYPNLNALRFLGAFLVLISHIELVKSYFGLPNYYENYRVALIGKLGVHIFFVLSGFLITSLLVNESLSTKTISINKFYIRRILKIWPLYFLISILGLFILPNLSLFNVPSLTEHLSENITTQSFLSLFFLQNVAIVLFPFLPLSFQLWSIAVEEQYYLVIPFIIKKVNKPVTFFLTVYFIYNITKEYISVKYSQNIHSTFWYRLHYFWYYFSVDSLSLGSIAALLYKRYPKSIQQLFFGRITQITTILLLLFSYYKLAGIYYYYQDEVYDFLIAIFILNAALNKNFILPLENKFFNFLGKISYSTYMIHVIVLALTFNILKNMNMLNNIAIYSTSIVLTYLLSILSYQFFESKIVDLKQKL